ncbi:MAG: aminotransferase class V-fold PLP-dependent enzyme [Planctomycetes bacterium]|nr:aminotransferase class V-fold PLP-dependent enzyme [Planctomycetota bacterium]
MSALDHPAAASFPGLDPAVAFLNAAYMTPKPAAALAALHASVDRLALPDFGLDDFYGPPERVRALLARLVGGAAEQYSLTGAVSFGVATLAWNLRVHADALVGRRRRVLGVDGQFPSNVQGWKRLHEAGFAFELVPGGAGATERLLARLGEDVAFVAVEPLSWTDGRRLDLAAVCGAAREHGALTCVDVTQSAGVDAPLDDALGCDVVVGAGYKWLLGPYGTGFLRLTPDLQRRLEPLEASWKNFENSQDFNRLTEYREGPYSAAARFDHGQSSAFARLAGWEAGLAWLDALGPQAVRAHARAFGAALAAGLDPARYEASDLAASDQAAHLFRVAPRDAASFAATSARLAAAGVRVSQRAGGWRVSPHVYNGAADLARALEAFA